MQISYTFRVYGLFVLCSFKVYLFMITGTFRSINCKIIFKGLIIGLFFVFSAFYIYSNSSYGKSTLIVSEYPYERVDELLGCDSRLGVKQRAAKLNESYLSKKVSVFKWAGEVTSVESLGGRNVLAIDIDGNIKTTELFLRVEDKESIYSTIGKWVSFNFMMVGSVPVKPVLEGGCDMAFEGELLLI